MWKVRLTMLFAFCTFCVAVFLAVRNESAGAWALANLAFIFFMATIFVGVLGWKVGGSQLSLERAVSNLQAENRELRSVVDALAKSTFVMMDGASLYNGPSPAHIRLLGRYMGGIGHLGSADILEQAKTELATETNADAQKQAAAAQPKNPP